MKTPLNFSKLRLTRKETVAEWDGTVGPAGDLKDVSGENWIWMSEQFSFWYPYHASMQEYAMKNPLDGALTAGIFSEDDTMNYHDMNIDMVPGVDNMGECFFRSVCVCSLNPLRQRIVLSGIETGVWYDLTGNGSVVQYWDNNSNGFVRRAGINRLKLIPTNENWFRIWYESYQRNIPGQDPGADDYNIYSCDNANNQVITGLNGPCYGIYAPMVVKVQPGCPGYPGPYHTTTYDVRKIALDLAKTGSPTTLESPFLAPNGSRYPARRFGSGNYYSCADNLHQRPGGLTYRSMQVFDSDHTVTIVFRLDEGTSNNVLFCHGRLSWDGLIIMGGIAYYSRSSAPPWFKMVQKKAGLTIDDGCYHIFQLVRENNVAKIWVDGLDGLSVDVTGYGSDNVNLDRNVILGTTPDGGSLDGEILYCRVDNRALTWQELNDERNKIIGTPKYSGGGSLSITYLTDDEHQKPFYRIAKNIPRVNNSLLIEGNAENYTKYTEAFDSWQKFNVTVISNSHLSPEYNKVTADTFRESGGVNVQEIMWQTVVDLWEGDWVWSLFLLPINRRYIYLDIWNIGGAFFDLIAAQIISTVGAATAIIEPYTNSVDRFMRCSIVFNNPSDATRYPEIFVSANGADPAHLITGPAQDAYYLWGSQLEEGKFPTSYFPNDGTLDSTFRSGDSCLVYPSAAKEFWKTPVFPEQFDNRGELTIEFEAKALWQGSVDISDEDRVLFEISGEGTTKNRISIWVDYTGVLRATFYDDSEVLHEAYTPIDPFSFKTWHTYKFYIDFANLANMAFTVDGAVPAGLLWTNKSGTGKFVSMYGMTAERIGEYFANNIRACAYFKNVRVEPRQF